MPIEDNVNIESRQANYVTANRFYIEMDNSLTASFSECSNFKVEIEHEIINEGGLNYQQRVLLGQPKFSNVTLSRGVTNDFSFWDWISSVMQKPKQRRNINILLFNQAGQTMQSWTLIGAVPVAWDAPALQANAKVVAIEQLTLAYEGLNVKNQPGNGASFLDSRNSTGFFG